MGVGAWSIEKGRRLHCISRAAAYFEEVLPGLDDYGEIIVQNTGHAKLPLKCNCAGIS